MYAEVYAYMNKGLSVTEPQFHDEAHNNKEKKITKWSFWEQRVWDEILISADAVNHEQLKPVLDHATWKGSIAGTYSQKVGAWVIPWKYHMFIDVAWLNDYIKESFSLLSQISLCKHCIVNKLHLTHASSGFTKRCIYRKNINRWKLLVSFYISLDIGNKAPLFGGDGQFIVITI